MIRTYLGEIKAIEMILKRLTKDQKAQIVEAYRLGEHTNDLAEKYSCSANTINRTVKTSISDSEYKLLKEKRSTTSVRKVELVDDHKKENLKQENSFIVPISKAKEEDPSEKIDKDLYNSEDKKLTSLALEDADDFGDYSTYESQRDENYDMNKDNQEFENNFEEIAPLVSDFDFNIEKQKEDFEIHNYDSLPKSVYMIVDKKVELASQLISELPEWSFLPENELSRNAILLFTNQRSAKRTCLKTQRVIKVPNTNVFNISKSYLISKGITRLIVEDLIIALDN